MVRKIMLYFSITKVASSLRTQKKKKTFLEFHYIIFSIYTTTTKIQNYINLNKDIHIFISNKISLLFSLFSIVSFLTQFII